MKVTTLKKIVDALKDISIQDRGHYPNHLQINKFGFGEQSNINELDVDGALMWLTPEESDVRTTLTTYRFNMVILDLLDNGDENVLDVMSDTAQIVSDIVKRLSSRSFKNSYGFTIVRETTPTPTIGNYAQKMAGWSTTIEFQVYNGALCHTAFASSIETPVTPTEFKYYIASVDDIYIYSTDFSVREDFPTYSKLGDFDFEPNVEIEDKIYVGYQVANPVRVAEGITLHTIIEKDFSDKWYLHIDYNQFAAKAYQRIAKLTPFTTADYSTPRRGFQNDWNSIYYAGVDLTVEYSIGDKIRVTVVDTGEIFYDIISVVIYKSGNTTVQGEMARYVQTLGLTVEIEKMTNIV